MADEELQRYSREHYEQQISTAKPLMVAHGAALAGALALLRGYESNPQLRGVGIFIAIFCFGFLTAALGYAALVFSRLIDLRVTYDANNPKLSPLWANRLSTASVALQGLSFLSLVVVVIFIGVRFYIL